MNIVASTFILGILTVGGIIDGNCRQIPNFVPILLIIVGFTFDFSPISDIIALIGIAVILLITEKKSVMEFKGGDFKLLCALGFAIGIVPLSIVILLILAEIMMMSIFKKQIIETFPLCAYAAPAYFLTLCVELYYGGI